MNGITNFKKVALDSNLFIYHFEDNPKFVSFTDKIFTNLFEGILRATTSVISIIETLSYPAPRKVIKEIEDAFLRIPNLEIVGVDQQIGIEAAKVRRKYGFRLPDSIQLATFLQSKSQAFITNDRRLKQFKELKIILLTEI